MLAVVWRSQPPLPRPSACPVVDDNRVPLSGEATVNRLREHGDGLLARLSSHPLQDQPGKLRCGQRQSCFAEDVECFPAPGTLGQAGGGFFANVNFGAMISG